LRDFSIALLLGLIIGTYSSDVRRHADPHLPSGEVAAFKRAPKVKLVRDTGENAGAVV
jgi:hypothetical protein